MPELVDEPSLGGLPGPPEIKNAARLVAVGTDLVHMANSAKMALQADAARVVRLPQVDFTASANQKWSYTVGESGLGTQARACFVGSM